MIRVNSTVSKSIPYCDEVALAGRDLIVIMASQGSSARTDPKREFH